MSQRGFRSGREWVVGFVLLMVAISGCSSQSSPEESVDLGVPSAAALAVLDKADAADGNIDKVVEKCVACKLKMKGNPEHTVNFGEYQLHFCTEFCKEAFTRNPEEALASLDETDKS
jgi:hypothetical protein